METLELIKRARAGDKLARDQVIRDNMALVYSIVARFGGRGYEMEDLGQIGAIGLIKAVMTYDSKKGNRLAAYAARCIDNELLMYLRSKKKTAREISLYEPKSEGERLEGQEERTGIVPEIRAQSHYGGVV